MSGRSVDDPAGRDSHGVTPGLDLAGITLGLDESGITPCAGFARVTPGLDISEVTPCAGGGIYLGGGGGGTFGTPCAAVDFAVVPWASFSVPGMVRSFFLHLCESLSGRGAGMQKHARATGERLAIAKTASG